ncbi:MAG: trypsin-like peptidase domain-containing protein [Planctomycetaceae bacterium]
MRHVWGVLLYGCIFAPAAHAATEPAVLESQQRRVDMIKRIAPAVVAIFSDDSKGGGSGVLVSADGFVVTNFHVIQGLGPFMKCGLNDRRIYDAVRVGIDPTGDLALIRLLGRTDFPHATLADSDTVRVGDEAYAVGNPFLLATDLQPTVTFGMVSGVHRYQYPSGTFLEYTDCLQVDASINPGNSGGPLFNADGEVIGINGRISVEKRGRVNVGAGYSISSNQVRYFLSHLRSGRIVDHATLGATVESHDDGAVVVDQILAGSEAYRRGLRQGDEIVTFGGRSIRSVNQFKNILGIYPKGWKLPLTYRRDGQKHEIAVRLRGLHRAAELTPQRRQAPPDEGPRRDGPRSPEQPEPQKPITPPGAPPEEYAHMYVERTGFFNYYFNEQESERVRSAFRSLGDFHDLTGLWTFAGHTDDGRAFQIKLATDAAAVKIGDAVSVQPLNQEFGDLPPKTGGLLPALQSLKMMLVDPDAYFSELYYVGQESLDGRGPLVDVLQTSRGQLTGRWYVAADNGRWLGFDTGVTEDADECEIRLDGWMPVNGRSLPQRITVRHGDAPVSVFQVEQVTLP